MSVLKAQLGNAVQSDLFDLVGTGKLYCIFKVHISCSTGRMSSGTAVQLARCRSSALTMSLQLVSVAARAAESCSAGAGARMTQRPWTTVPNPFSVDGPDPAGGHGLMEHATSIDGMQNCGSVEVGSSSGMGLRAQVEHVGVRAPTVPLRLKNPVISRA